MKRVMLMAALMASGCTTMVVRGKAMSAPPKGFEWCGPKPLELGPSTPGGEGGLLPPAIFRHCSKLILPKIDDDDFVGTAAFGVTTNDFGYITSVCFWGTNYAHAEEYVECVGQAIAKTEYRLEPNQTKGVYKVTFVLE